MTVHCPHCLTGYLLPEHLLGPEGARVRCPGCQGVFVVLPEGGAAAEVPGDAGPVSPEATPDATSGAGPAPAAESPTAPEPAPDPDQVAASVLDVFADFLGEALARSRSRGTVLSDHGPAIVAVWDEYRRRAGADAPPAAFRAALRDRCGVDLSVRNGS